MYLADCHTHTCCSPDSTAALEDMVRTAEGSGLGGLCTTDHCDLLNQDGSPLEGWDWSPILEQYRRVEPLCPPGFRLTLGLELGGAQADPRKAEELLAGAPLDFVIGVVHNQSPAIGGKDFIKLEYITREQCKAVMDDYFESLLALAPLPCYDSLGHIFYPMRYIKWLGGYHLSLKPWQDQLDAVLKTVIETGRAIEVNTYRGREVGDWLPILRRYKELGGELVTLGSDAHSPQQIGLGLARAVRVLEMAEFRYVMYYSRRKPEPIKL